MKRHHHRLAARMAAPLLLLVFALLCECNWAGGIRKSSSFVAPTSGSAHALTLTTYLTGAADLHVATVAFGHAPLLAEDIKAAATRCSVVSCAQLNGKDEGVVVASTVAVDKAQKVERVLDGLQPNTSYDVYFVAEVPNSNGVFGPVLSVVGTSTYPSPPTISVTIVAAANASTSSALVNMTLSAPGTAHFAFIRSGRIQADSTSPLTPEAIVTRRLDGADAVFARAGRMSWEALSIQVVVDGLAPATEYDAFLVAEAPGRGTVFSSVDTLPKVVQTHATAPDIVSVDCSPRDASSSEIDVEFELQFPIEDIRRVTSSTLPRYAFQLHFEIDSDSDNDSVGLSVDKARIDSLSVGPFQSIDELVQASAQGPQRHTISGLAAGTTVSIRVSGETANSHGVVGQSLRAAACRTHAKAPAVGSATLRPMNGTVDALQVEVEFERPGTAHYLIAPASCLSSIQPVYQQASSMQALQQKVTDAIKDSSLVRVGNFMVESPPTNSSLPVGSRGTSIVEGFTDQTAYVMVIMPETTSSQGVFGPAFGHVLEATTNENASEVLLLEAAAVPGSLSAIEAWVSMAKPEDVLFACLARESSDHKECSEVPREDRKPVAHGATTNFSFIIANLSEDSAYIISVFPESRHHNGVRGSRTPSLPVKTHRAAPPLELKAATPMDARTDAVSLRIQMEEKGFIHYAVVVQVTDNMHDDSDGKGGPEIDVEYMVAISRTDPETASSLSHTHHQREAHRHRGRQTPSPPASNHRPGPQLVRRGHVFVSSQTEELDIDGLDPNTTYAVYAVSETAEAATAAPTKVFGQLRQIQVLTHDLAPKIVKSSAAPLANQTDSIVVTVNVTRPGIVHYHIVDVDFADPAVIAGGLRDRTQKPHAIRGTFMVEFSDMGIEIKNGTNDTQPMDPLVFSSNATIGGLQETTMYHVSLTTETIDSNGVYGEFPAPMLVMTHSPAPKFAEKSLLIAPEPGSSSSLSVQFNLDQLGEVHYALFFRGIVADRSSVAREEDEASARERILLDEGAEIASNHTPNVTEASNSSKSESPRWPPVPSLFDVSTLTPRALKDATIDELGEGVWDNGTISVSRDDVLRRKRTEKKFDKLPSNAVFDVCVVPETADSDGVFGRVDCRRVVTHADYTNQSTLLDEVELSPVDATTDALHIKLTTSKLLDAPPVTIDPALSDIENLSRATGRVPYFVLLDSSQGHAEFSVHTHGRHRHDHRSVSPFKLAAPGRGNVVDTGVLSSITAENETFVIVEHTMQSLAPNREYYLFFAYETAHSDGVFTATNPHKHRPNETSENHRRQPESIAIHATTHEPPPELDQYEAVPSYGNSSRVTVKFDIACASCEQASTHIFVLEEGCPVPTPATALSLIDEITASNASDRQQPCALPLLYDHMVVNMTEPRAPSNRHQRHQHHHHHHSGKRVAASVEHDIDDDVLLHPNTTYQVLIATETFNSNGVISPRFHATSVTTYALAPHFKQLSVSPRTGSTTEAMLVFELEAPGEVHYMLGVSNNPELNVTSPYNVSAKSLLGERDSKLHNYARDVVRTRRSIKAVRPGHVYVEVIDYLVAGTPYDVFVVAETKDDAGVYGDVHEFLGVSTFPSAPMVLAHTAFSTPGTVDKLTLGLRVEDDAPCVVHAAVITSTLYAATSRVAEGSDTFGNRLAMEDLFVTRTSIEIDAKSEWHEVNLTVPFPGTNYTVHLVTESKDSGGVFGTVATHTNVQSHREPPTVLSVRARPADARVDALAVEVEISHEEGAHIQYAALRHGQRFQRSAITSIGRVDVNGSSQSTFVIEGLHGRTTYDVYLRLETFESGGVIGEWSAFPVIATTHGLPAEVLESFACDVVPSCEAIGRHACSHVANVCGACLDGFHGVDGSSNAPCVTRPPRQSQRQPELVSNPVEGGVTITINGVSLDTLQRYVEHQVDAASESHVAPVIMTSETDTGECPLHSRQGESGHCECASGYEEDSMGSRCMPAHTNAPMQFDFATHAM